MYSIFVGVIEQGGFDLTALLRNIDAYHIEGKLTDTERTELYALARQAAEPDYNVKLEIESMWNAIRDLQTRVSTLENPGGSSEEESEEDWPEFVQPTGALNAYQRGDKVTYKGKHYECFMNNCVWTPDVYPDAWMEVD